MSFYTPFLFGLTEVKTTAAPGIAADITFYPRSLGHGYGYFSHTYNNYAARDFLFDNNVAGYGRTETDDLAVVAKAQEAGFSTRIVEAI